MRLKWGPHAHWTAEQVVLRDPLYVVQVLADPSDSVLGRVFRDLILRFDETPLRQPCARCGGRSDGLCAYPSSTALIGFCDACVSISAAALPRPADRIVGYEDAVRHVATSFQRGHRINMRRIIVAMSLAKGGPTQMTEAATHRFLAAAPPPTSILACRSKGADSGDLGRKQAAYLQAGCFPTPSCSGLE